MGEIQHLYINTPFCPSLCHFCNFYKNDTRTHEKFFPGENFSADVLKELDLQSHLLSDQIRSIYIGGGSPLEMKGRDIGIILASLHQRFDLANAEITVESNPFWPKDTGLLKSGLFNRISIGVQSFSLENLKRLGRSLIPDLDFLENVGNHVPRVSLDFVYDIPGESPAELLFDIAESSRLAPEHLSWYSLEITSDVFRKRFSTIEETRFSEAFEILLNRLEEERYRQYELSNFARNGASSIHNQAYWEHKSYLGMGPGAFGSYWHPEKKQTLRTMNEKNLGSYRKALSEGRLPVKTEELLTEGDLRNEYVFLSLRKTEGLDLAEYQRRYRESFEEGHRATLESFPAYFSRNSGKIALTRLGFVYYNFLCSELIRLQAAPIL
ncbi:MAG: coproporphyrinogen III oxidase family protein [Spirochaetia bacterium]|nr:coproporphyrinogen III oxidase family protein [Spirochaetia bacterium]